MTTRGTNRHSGPSAQRYSSKGALNNLKIRANTYRNKKAVKGTEAEKTQKLSSNLEFLYQLKEQKKPGSFQKFINDTNGIKSDEDLSHQVKKEIVKELKELTELDAADIAEIGSNSKGKEGEKNLTGYIEALKKKLEKENPNLAKKIENTEVPDLLGKDKTEPKPAEEQKDPDSVMDFPDAANPQLADLKNKTQALKDQDEVSKAQQEYVEALQNSSKLKDDSAISAIKSQISAAKSFAGVMQELANSAKDAFEIIKANREKSKQQADSALQRQQAGAQRSQEEQRKAATATTAT
ncbi:MAG: hypothetical protein ACJA1M_000910 [Alphaproteobacteria bacterium]|jgi:hypothetical protein